MFVGNGRKISYRTDKYLFIDLYFKHFSTCNWPYCILNLLTTSFTESPVFVRLRKHLPDGDLVKVETRRRDPWDKWVFIIDLQLLNKILFKQYTFSGTWTEASTASRLNLGPNQQVNGPLSHDNATGAELFSGLLSRLGAHKDISPFPAGLHLRFK